VVLATLAMAALLAFATVGIDWVGLHGHDGLRVAWLAASLAAAALVYFGVLYVAGFRPRDFFRRG
jgi:putative peptidoglycan lipid II flippase